MKILQENDFKKTPRSIDRLNEVFSYGSLAHPLIYSKKARLSLAQIKNDKLEN